MPDLTGEEVKKTTREERIMFRMGAPADADAKEVSPNSLPLAVAPAVTPEIFPAVTATMMVAVMDLAAEAALAASAAEAVPAALAAEAALAAPMMKIASEEALAAVPAEAPEGGAAGAAAGAAAVEAPGAGTVTRREAQKATRLMVGAATAGVARMLPEIAAMPLKKERGNREILHRKS